MTVAVAEVGFEGFRSLVEVIGQLLLPEEARIGVELDAFVGERVCVVDAGRSVQRLELLSRLEVEGLSARKVLPRLVG